MHFAGDGEVTVLSVTSPDEIVVRYVEDNAQLATMQKELLRHGTGSSAIRLYSVKTGMHAHACRGFSVVESEFRGGVDFAQ